MDKLQITGNRYRHILHHSFLFFSLSVLCHLCGNSDKLSECHVLFTTYPINRNLCTFATETLLAFFLNLWKQRKPESHPVCVTETTQNWRKQQQKKDSDEAGKLRMWFGFFLGHCWAGTSENKKNKLNKNNNRKHLNSVTYWLLSTFLATMTKSLDTIALEYMCQPRGLGAKSGQLQLFMWPSRLQITSVSPSSLSQIHKISKSSHFFWTYCKCSQNWPKTWLDSMSSCSPWPVMSVTCYWCRATFSVAI